MVKEKKGEGDGDGETEKVFCGKTKVFFASLTLALAHFPYGYKTILQDA